MAAPLRIASQIETPHRLWRVAALAWLLVVAVVAVHQWHFWRSGALHTDVMALLPDNEQAPEVGIATRNLVDGLSRQVMVVIGSEHWQDVQQASTLARAHMAVSAVPLQERALPDGSGMAAALAFYAPWRDRLLTPAQRQALNDADAKQLTQQAMAALYQPAAQARLSEWRADPLGLWPQWWAARAAQSSARPRDGWLWLQAQGKHWSVLTWELEGAAFGFTGQAALAQALGGLEAKLQTQWPHMQMLRAGMPLHAEAAAQQAHSEVNTIGWGSLLGVLLLAWLAFRSVRSIVLVGLSLAVGTAVALSVTAWWFGQVHVLTLVFGASLVGVAEDYGIHYFAARQSHRSSSSFALMRRLMPSLWLALGTSAIAYMALGAASFPGLRQMAVFSVVGLTAALLTVLCWLPWLDTGAVPVSKFAHRLGGSLKHWPRLPQSARAWLLYAVLVGAGLWASMIGLQVQDDVRQLQNAPQELVAQQVRIGEMLDLPSPTQFYVVHGNSEQQVLENEEQLAQRLQALVANKTIAGWSAVSDWVPSLSQQHSNAALTALREQVVLTHINAALGEDMVRPQFAQAPLTVQMWLQQPIAAAARNLWIGPVGAQFMSVVMLRGVTDRSALPHLESAAQGLDGVRWVDKPQEISHVLQRYRQAMTWLLVAGHALVLMVLCAYFGKQAWRAWLPTVLASVGVLVFMALTGQPWQLFSVLGLVLLLGVGVDYGIFLLEHEDDPSAWLAVLIGAGSTWLAFGLLGLSQTPALQAFGSTLMVGLPLVLCLAPCFRARLPARAQTAP